MGRANKLDVFSWSRLPTKCLDRGFYAHARSDVGRNEKGLAVGFADPGSDDIGFITLDGGS